ncbi:hypothetical protein FVE85_0927 [Porphyridium purpureum]|uniref:Uncharacterized protein n=1 Tax=Porphyridium purpureum TaxID=35688 RepID=A0A5J4Z1J2_PORPP|nr:hypothetical protein FVE85_0927 [Porphyridium purpureum]|eukprot:POR2300..scf208_2
MRKRDEIDMEAASAVWSLNEDRCSSLHVGTFDDDDRKARRFVAVSNLSSSQDSSGTEPEDRNDTVLLVQHDTDSGGISGRAVGSNLGFQGAFAVRIERGVLTSRCQNLANPSLEEQDPCEQTPRNRRTAQQVFERRSQRKEGLMVPGGKRHQFLKANNRQLLDIFSRK